MILIGAPRGGVVLVRGGDGWDAVGGALLVEKCDRPGAVDSTVRSAQNPGSSRTGPIAISSTVAIQRHARLTFRASATHRTI